MNQLRKCSTFGKLDPPPVLVTFLKMLKNTGNNICLNGPTVDDCTLMKHLVSW